MTGVWEQCRLLGIVHRYTKTSKCEWYRGGQDSRRHRLLNRPDIGSPCFYSLLLPTGVVLGWGWWTKGISILYRYKHKEAHCSWFMTGLYLLPVQVLSDSTWDIISILFYESRKQNDISTMNFNDQLLSCNFFSLPFKQGWLQQRHPPDRRRQLIGQRRQDFVRLVTNSTRLAANARLFGTVAWFLPNKHHGRYVSVSAI